MMAIHVYSDSFGADKDEDGQWPCELAKLQGQELTGNGMGGTGPNFSLRKLVNDLENRKIKNFDSIIVLLSDQKRMQFPWLDHDELADGIFLLAEELPENSLVGTYLEAGDITEDSSLEDIKIHCQFNKTRYKKYEKEIKTVANTLGPMFLYENVKNITFLHLLSKQFKNKFLVFTCFSLDHFTSRYKNFNIKSTKLLHKLKFDYLNSPNFYFVNTPISYMVGATEGDDWSDISNHMTPEQNKKFALMCNDILNDDTPDTSWFKYTPYDDPFAEDFGDEPPPPRFIYE